MACVFKKVLFIDDDPVQNDLCTYVVETLPNCNELEILSFTNPEEGFQYIATTCSQHPVTTVLFLDVNMPELTGWDVLEKMKELNNETLQHITTYILSSSIDIADIRKAAAHPLVKGFISKPLTSHLQRIFTDTINDNKLKLQESINRNT